MNGMPLLERAMELVYSGDYITPGATVKQLGREGYEHANQHLSSKSVKSMLLAERERGLSDRAADTIESFLKRDAATRA